MSMSDYQWTTTEATQRHRTVGKCDIVDNGRGDHTARVVCYSGGDRGYACASFCAPNDAEADALAVELNRVMDAAMAEIAVWLAR
jgi:hypothetical protein